MRNHKILPMTSLAAIAAGFSCIADAQTWACPAGQVPYYSQRQETARRDLVVPGTASGLFSGVVMRPGLEYQVDAGGSIRVGVFGETGTPPLGWEPQGPAGNGYPSPDSYTFSLIYRKGRSGPWQFAGGNPTSIRLGPNDAPQELFFAINDTRTNDNSGQFNVTVREIALPSQVGCRAAPPPSTVRTPPMNYMGGRVGKPSAKTGGGGVYQPCAGKTPDGQKQGFTFGSKCPGSDVTQPIPVEACSYKEAREEAMGLVGPFCHLAET